MDEDLDGTCGKRRYGNKIDSGSNLFICIHTDQALMVGRYRDVFAPGLLLQD